uniref:EF-hand domain-containing protein n=1 Tax=Eutreptiella gymnastica TaxID=73025 RepID=A0A7S1NTG7_9EUGL|mmetsp:Transcript_86607/g.150775  ORF Transcript_86607/g.150775 Transcript_86607/m.150775 type:complete len:350 (+) Transcript_86607:64-1113(+)
MEPNLQPQTASPSGPRIQHKNAKLSHAMVIKYGYILPKGYAEDKTYPVVIVLGNGPQMHMELFWAEWLAHCPEEADDGWLVIGPTTCGSRTPGVGYKENFFAGDKSILQEFCNYIQDTWPCEGSRFHYVGIGNGAETWVRLASTTPRFCYSLTLISGFPAVSVAGPKQVAQLQGIPTTMYCGGSDRPTLRRMKAAAAVLRGLRSAAPVAVEVFPGDTAQSLAVPMDMFWHGLANSRRHMLNLRPVDAVRGFGELDVDPWPEMADPDPDLVTVDMTEAGLRGLFHRLDTNGDDWLDEAEFTAGFAELDHYGLAQQAHKQLRAILKKFNVLGGGKVSYPEFVLIVAQLRQR